jgi:hypothetical protein
MHPHQLHDYAARLVPVPETQVLTRLADGLVVALPGDAQKGGKQHRSSIWGRLCKHVRGGFLSRKCFARETFAGDFSLTVSKCRSLVTFH